MNNITKTTLFKICQAVICLSLASCSTIARYDQVAYQNATSLKVDANNLMDLSNQPYSSHEKEIAEFQTKIEKAYQYDFGRPKNQITVKQWDILRNPSGDLLGGFLAEWKVESSLKPVYIKDKQVQVGRAFDTIIGLESGKIKPSSVQ
jgi:hypothetical protein